MRARGPLFAGLLILGLLAAAAVPGAAGAGATTTTVAIHNTHHSVITSTPIGTTVHPKVTVTGTGTPTGSAAVSVYSGGSCAGSPVSSSAKTVLVSGAIDLTAFTVSPGAVGQLSFKAVFYGTNSFTNSTSSCVALTVTKATPGLVLEIHNAGHTLVSSVLIGQNIHARVTASGAAGLPTGEVFVKWYANNACSGSPFTGEALTIDTDGVMEGKPQTSATATIRSAHVEYAGNSIYNARTSACKTITFTKAIPGVKLGIHDPEHVIRTDFPVGTKIHPLTTLSGALGTPTGTVSIGISKSADCTGETSWLGGVPLVNGALDNANQAFTQNTVGTFSMRIQYDGDSKYVAAYSPCVAYDVTKLGTTTAVNIHTAAHAIPIGIVEGTSVHPYVTITATGKATTPTGTVDLVLRADSCAGSVLQISPNVPLLNGIADVTALSVAPDPGSYAFTASYDGDAKHLISTDCRTFTVTAAPATPPPPTLAPTPTAQASLPPGVTPPPTATPGATTSPGATTPPGASPAPGQSQATGASPLPGTSEAPVGSFAAGESPVPGDSVNAGETSGASAPATSDGPAGSNSPLASGGPGATAAPAFDVGANIAGLPIFAWIGLVLLGAIILIFIGMRLGRRRRAAPTPPGLDPVAPTPSSPDAPQTPDAPAAPVDRGPA